MSLAWTILVAEPQSQVARLHSAEMNGASLHGPVLRSAVVRVREAPSLADKGAARVALERGGLCLRVRAEKVRVSLPISTRAAALTIEF